MSSGTSLMTSCHGKIFRCTAIFHSWPDQVKCRHSLVTLPNNQLRSVTPFESWASNLVQRDYRQVYASRQQTERREIRDYFWQLPVINILSIPALAPQSLVTFLHMLNGGLMRKRKHIHKETSALEKFPGFSILLVGGVPSNTDMVCCKPAKTLN